MKEVSKTKKVRVSIYLPADHPLAQKDVKERAAYAKELIEFAFNYKESFEYLKKQMNHVEKVLEGGVTLPEITKLDDATDKALNDTLMGIINGF